MKILILGSSGQIGSALKKYCDMQIVSATEFDIVRSSEEDLRMLNNTRLLECLDATDFVMFLAYDVGGARYLGAHQNQFEFISNNSRIMENTFCALRKTAKPFIFVSSQMADLTFSPYGALKAVGEHYTRALGGVIVKLWNVYGVETDANKSHVITDFIQKAHKNRLIDMITDGTESRQFLHAEDCSRCLLTLADQYSALPRNLPLHVASFKWSTIQEVAEHIALLFPGTEIQAAEAKDQVQQNSKIDPDPVIRQYWEPTISLPVGIPRIAVEMGVLEG